MPLMTDTYARWLTISWIECLSTFRLLSRDFAYLADKGVHKQPLINIFLDKITLYISSLSCIQEILQRDRM